DTVAIGDVGLGGFEHVGGDAPSLFDDGIDYRDDSAADRHRRARRHRAEARHAIVAVALRDLDRLGRDAEPLGRQPAIQRAVPLPARLHTNRQQQFALPWKSDPCAFAGLAAGVLEKTRDAQAAAPAAAL